MSGGFIDSLGVQRKKKDRPGEASLGSSKYHHIQIPKKKKGGTHSCNLPKRPYKRRRPFHATSYTHIRFLKSVLITNKSHTNESQVFFVFFFCFCFSFLIFLCLSSYQFNFRQPQQFQRHRFLHTHHRSFFSQLQNQ